VLTRFSLLAAAFLIPVLAVAQKPPTPSPAPSPAPASSSPTHSPSPAPSPSVSPSHTPSLPSPSRTPSSAPAMPKNSPSSSASSSTSASNGRRVSSEPKSPNPTPTKSADLKRVESDATKSKSTKRQAVERDDLQKPCKKQPCAPACPPGVARDAKGECVSSPVSKPAIERCLPNQIPSPSGTGCIDSSNQCALGQIWNGQTCAQDPAFCNGGAALTQSIVAEAEALRLEMAAASCSSTSTSASCQPFLARKQSLYARYQASIAAAPFGCRGLMPLFPFIP